jgi:hypothetical protein
MIQQSHFWVYIQKKTVLKETFVRLFSLQHHSQYTGGRRNPNVHRQKNGLNKMYIHSVEYFFALEENESCTTQHG